MLEGKGCNGAVYILSRCYLYMCSLIFLSGMKLLSRTRRKRTEGEQCCRIYFVSTNVAVIDFCYSNVAEITFCLQYKTLLIRL